MRLTKVKNSKATLNEKNRIPKNTSEFEEFDVGARRLRQAWRARSPARATGSRGGARARTREGRAVSRAVAGCDRFQVLGDYYKTYVFFVMARVLRRNL